MAWLECGRRKKSGFESSALQVEHASEKSDAGDKSSWMQDLVSRERRGYLVR